MKVKSILLVIIIILSVVIIINDQRITNKNTELSIELNETNIPIIRFSDEVEDQGNSYPGQINEPIPEPDIDDNPP